MDLEKLEKIGKSVLKSLSKCDGQFELSLETEAKAEFDNLLSIAGKVLPDHLVFFKELQSNAGDLYPFEACQAIEHILAIVEIEKASETKIKEMKIFESAEDKMKQAELSFRKDDYPSTFHNLNTTLELVLKDKLGIPITITRINTAKIIDILVRHKVEPDLYLAEAKKRVIIIDNKIKHQGYSPSKVDCINGIKAMEELISRLRNKEIELSEEIKDKIYQGL